MKLYDEKGEEVQCRCTNPASFEPVRGQQDEEGVCDQYQCLVCGMIRDGKYWGE